MRSISSNEEKILSPAGHKIISAYESAWNPKKLPSLEILDSAFMSEFGANMAVLEQNEYGEFTYLFYGDKLQAIDGVNLTLKSTAHQSSRVSKSLKQHFREALKAHRPLVALERQEAETAAPILWERVFLPFKDVHKTNSTLIVTYAEEQEYTASILQEILDSATDGIIAAIPKNALKDRIIDYSIVLMNAAFMELLRAPEKSFIEMRLSTLLNAFKIPENLFEKYVSVIHERRTIIHEISIQVNGVARWFRIAGSPMSEGVVFSFVDITTLKELNLKLNEQKKALEEEIKRREHIEKELSILANFDHMTKIANRRSMEEHCLSVLKKAEKKKILCAILSLDIDHFKRVNDSFGHAAGDLAIITVARIAKECLRKPEDSAARMGGEEITLFLYDVTQKEILVLSEKMRKQICSEKMLFEDKAFSVTISIGVTFTTAVYDYETLLKRADEALYTAKHNGRDRFEINEKVA